VFRLDAKETEKIEKLRREMGLQPNQCFDSADYKVGEKLWFVVLGAWESSDEKNLEFTKQVLQGKIDSKVSFHLGCGKFLGQKGVMVFLYNVKFLVVKNHIWLSNNFGCETVHEDWVRLGKRIKPFYIKSVKERIIYT